METQEYDVIIVGLGCVGLSAAYYCSNQGLKVLGVEKNATSGAAGTSSQGYTRTYRFNDENPVKNEMMGISMKIWNEASDKLKALKNQGRTEEHRNIEPELLFPLDYLTYGDKNS